MSITNKIKALRRAKFFVANGSESFVCLALSEVRYQNPELAESCEELRSYINRVLGSNTTIDDWLFRNRSNSADMNLREVRLKWIEWMISCLQEDLRNKRKGCV